MQTHIWLVLGGFLLVFFVCFRVTLHHFGFVLSKLILLGLVFFQYCAKRLAGKNVAEMTYLLSTET